MPIKRRFQFKNPPKWLILTCLIIAGEIIFSLPFHVIRYFRPTFLEVFQLTNTQVGDAIAVYGITAMIAYFPSGVIADRFSARKLMSISLFATALGGIWLAFLPNQLSLSVSFGYWGVSNILLFWSAMLRTTREWGGNLAQGRAFGILDGGRGLMSAVAASVAVLFLSAFLKGNMEEVSVEQTEQALKSVIWMYTVITFFAGILIWLFIPDVKIKATTSESFKGIIKVLKRRSTWLQAAVIICAYCGYKGLDFYTIYGVDTLGIDEVTSARLMSNAAYLRPVGAVAAGFIADRFTTKKTIISLFGLLTICYVLLLLFSPEKTSRVLIFINLGFTILVVFALRGVYFALFEETRVPKNLTGTTIGLVSLVGFTPDIFFNSVAGRIIDASPGKEGYFNFYLLLMIFAFVGLLTTILLRTKNAR